MLTRGHAAIDLVYLGHLLPVAITPGLHHPFLFLSALAALAALLSYKVVPLSVALPYIIANPTKQIRISQICASSY